MKFQITKWSLSKLYTYYKANKINLSPPYQRNFIWATDDQQILIESIHKKIPIPSFFILMKSANKYEMVDGQQRSRTIISYIDKGFKDLSNMYFDKKKNKSFLKFEIPITIISDRTGESIEKFYALVNKTGIHVNKPEIRKADFYNTNYLKLVEEIASSKNFIGLKLFTETSLKRMNNVEFISELVVLIKNGHVDKKGLIDEYFKSDFTKEEISDIQSKFDTVLSKIVSLNKVYGISRTRYKQRNDFYTLFDFILKHNSLTIENLKLQYKLLVLIGKDIKPTLDECKSLKEYAINCVTQSNSKLARENRLEFFENLLLNRSSTLNSVQKDVLKFYGLKAADIRKMGTYLSIDVSALANKMSDRQIEFTE